MWAELTYDANTGTWALPIVRVIATARAVSDTLGVQHPASIFRLWPPAALAAIGFAPFREDRFDRARYTSGGSSDSLVEGEVVRSHAVEPRAIDGLKSLRRGELRALRDQTVHAGIEWSPDGGATVHVVQTDERSLNRVANTLLLLDKTGRATQGWRMRNDRVETVAAADFLDMAIAVGDHVDACYQAQASHEVAIDALSDAQAVIDYDITTGWPAVAPAET